ncbi:MAG: SDR family NAD(P)-dependent oxidoreductase [Thermoplasmata archaeon]|nr:SDR family NAD(P)-dependent oxidoreductase [Thermoplasmata archaeon]
MPNVALVTGASRGAGKAIATELGRSGWTVYITGRSLRTAPSPEGVPGTLEETAEAVDAAGGQGIIVHCDHTRLEEIDALAWRLRNEAGHLDLLVNNAWGGYEHHDVSTFGRSFWEQPAQHWDGMFVAGVRSTLLTSARIAPMMIERKQGLIANTVAWLDGAYLGNLYYDVAKSALVRMTQGMAAELRPTGVTAVAVAPGFIRTERVMAAHAAQPFDLAPTESPTYLGRAVAALVADSNVSRFAGSVLYVGDLARIYNFQDIDGRQPPRFVPSDPTAAPSGAEPG